ncbi:hypothetical protein JTB14_001521 [Gonioctena quinquepunctata]|nr:hypothetical protein JTB14_001521 [Gonioctena quinquepunctata]
MRLSSNCDGDIGVYGWKGVRSQELKKFHCLESMDSGFVHVFVLSFLKLYFNPSNPRDAEELLNYLESLESDDAEAGAINHANEIKIALCPPTDGADSDVDDASSDDDAMCLFRDVGKGILKESMERVEISKQGKNNIHFKQPQAKVGEASDGYSTSNICKKK